MSFFKKISNLLDSKILDKAFIFRFMPIHYFFMVSFLVFDYLVNWILANYKTTEWIIFYWQWYTANAIRDISLYMILFFFLNFIYVIISYISEESKKDWFTFDEKIKSYKEIPVDVLNTWIYKYLFLYMLNLNVLLIFSYIVITNYTFGFRPTISVVLSLSIIIFCLLFFIIFWINYFYCFYKFKKQVK